MAEPFLGEIRMFGFGHAPKNWSLCNGQFLPINQNQALFSLLGTMYGGNGQTTFALPDLRGRVPIHVGGGFTQGQRAGQEAHTLTQSEMPAHNHILHASATQGTNADFTQLTNPIWAKSSQNAYASPANLVTMNAQTVGTVGGSQAHNNMQPYLTINFCIALTGIFPSPN
jgi:microcystin-dependent protein